MVATLPRPHRNYPGKKATVAYQEGLLLNVRFEIFQTIILGNMHTSRTSCVSDDAGHKAPGSPDKKIRLRSGHPSPKMKDHTSKDQVTEVAI
jgi:hypothetical protein